MGSTLSAKMTLKDGYGFGGFSLAPPSKQHLSTPPPPGCQCLTIFLTSLVLVYCNVLFKEYC